MSETLLRTVRRRVSVNVKDGGLSLHQLHQRPSFPTETLLEVITFQAAHESVHTSALLIISALKTSHFLLRLPLRPRSSFQGAGLKLPCMHLLVPVMHLCSFTDSAPSIIIEKPRLCSPWGLESLPGQSKSQSLRRTGTRTGTAAA